MHQFDFRSVFLISFHDNIYSSNINIVSYVISGKMLGQILVTKQTGPQGKVVSKV